MKFGHWISGVFLCASLLLGTSCERLKKAASGSGSEEGNEERELGEAYVLDVREPEYAKGFTTTSTTKMAAPDSESKVKVGQKTVEGTCIRSAVSRTVMQVLGKDRLRVTEQIEKRTEVFRMTGGPTNSEQEEGVLVGQHVLLERKEGRWVARFESGKKPNAEEREGMGLWETTFNDQLEIPEKEVRRIGEEWEEDVEYLGKGKAQLRFDRLEDYQGLRCAVVVGTVQFSDKTADGGNVEFEGKVRTYRSLDYFQDLYSEMDGVLTGTAYPQLGMTVEMKGPFTMTTTTVLSNPWAEEQARKAAEAAAKAAEEAAAAAKAAEEEAAKAAAKALEVEGEVEGKPGGADAGGGEEAVEEEAVEESLEAPVGEEEAAEEPLGESVAE